MRAQPLGLRSGDRELLESWTRSTSIRAGLAQRARIVLLAADGVSNTEIAERVGVSRQTVISLAGPLCHLRGRRVWPMSSGRVGRGRWTGPDLGRDADAAAGEAGDHALVVAAARRASEGGRVDGAADLAASPGAAVAGGDVQVLHRPGAGRQGHRRRRAVSAPAGERDRAQRRREVPDPGVGPDPEDVADAARAGRAAHPRLRPARHHHLVRRLGDRHRRGHRDLQTTAPPPGVPGVPAPRRPRLPRPASCI